MLKIDSIIQVTTNHLKISQLFNFRWKERFFILTNDYFHCFKKGSFKVTEMGEFIFKVFKYISVSVLMSKS